MLETLEKERERDACHQKVACLNPWISGHFIAMRDEPPYIKMK